ncbi:Hint domain-containing protein [Palleronia abyssalis]|uniref:Hedgehog/Intein (Hint) domain-containing protein n=1 Tax=Palleronia abyssalis TaxID=1501240 RepID=A0A2R8BXP9_9RHOB|nr:Hint domain-containing protein [Palleronia abyssalis]SPJ24954.1 hypothetical protein PAA8504_02796 [Palleronia abyssalis]
MNAQTGFRGTYVMAWSQIRIDGLAGLPVAALEPGVEWRWQGDAQRIDGASSILTLTDPVGGQALRRHAGRAAARLLKRAQVHVDPAELDEIDATAIGTQFALTDGRRVFEAALLHLTSSARPLIVFTDHLPPANVTLTVLRGPAPLRPADAPADVICFTPGTVLATKRGPKTVEALRIGDMIQTRDNGYQPLMWVGTRPISGARLHVMPNLRPIRVPSGAFTPGDPRGDLVISPRHRVLLRGQAAQALFNQPEVLVAARDLVGHRGIHVDRKIAQLTYVHLMLPRHEIVWANGVATESFHPAHTCLSEIPDDQRAHLFDAMPDLAQDPARYGPEARRMLSPAEAQILLHDGEGRQALRRAAQGCLTPPARAV